MAVDLDVCNRDGSLSPGMYPDVKWPVRRARNGRAEWVDVKKGAAEGDPIEMMGNIQAGDKVVRRSTDEIRDRFGVN